MWGTPRRTVPSCIENFPAENSGPTPPPSRGLGTHPSWRHLSSSRWGCEVLILYILSRLRLQARIGTVQFLRFKILPCSHPRPK